MKGFIKWGVIVSSFFTLFLGCKSITMNKKFEKIGVEGDDFYLKHYDTNLKRGVIVLNVFSKKDKDFLYNYGLFINDLTFFESNKKQSAKNLLIA